MIISRRIRTFAALILLIGLLGYLALQAFNSLAALPQRFTFAAVQPDDVTVWQERFKKMLPVLPQTGLVGYLSERNFPGLGGDPYDQDEEFAMTQYVIAPRILQEGSFQANIIVNLSRLPFDQVQRVTGALGLTYVDEYGNGLYLYRRSQP